MNTSAITSQSLGRLERRDLLKALTVLVLLVGAAAAIAVFVPEFYNRDNLFNVLRQAAILGIVTLGQALVLLVAGIDLSVGAVIGVTLTVLATAGPSGLIPAVLLALLIGAVIGSVNGLLVTVREVPAFVATLGMAVLLEGARLAYTKGSPSGDIPAALRPLGLSGLGIVPYAFLLFAGLAALLWVLLNRTAHGRRVYATGTNSVAARLAGVRVGWIVFTSYVLCSVLAVVAGTVLSAYVGYVDRYIGAGFDLDSIAAAVVGGVAFVGGKGRIGGVILGVLFVTVLLNLVVLIGVDPNVRLVVRGAVIVAAVAFFTLRARREE